MALSVRKIENDTEIDRILNKEGISPLRPTGFVEVGEDNVCLPALYIDYEEKLRKFEVRDDDYFLVSSPKTGTTWCQEMMWLMVNNLNYEGAKRNISLRFPLLETPAYINTKFTKSPVWIGPNPWQFMDDQASPRCIKSHLHWSLLPEQIRNGTKTPKIISILRNPRDTFISYYHYIKLMEGYKGNFEDFAEIFLAGRNVFGPYLKTALSLWNQRHRPNVLIIKFKDMKTDLPLVIRQVSNFLEKPLTDEEVEKMAAHLSLEQMKKNDAVNKSGLVKRAEALGVNISGSDFVRKGKEGGYKDEMSPELIERFAKWEKENLEGTGLIYD